MSERTSIHGNRVRIPRQGLIPRPSVCAAIVSAGEALVTKSRHGGDTTYQEEAATQGRGLRLP
jgi:hypothetical protein